jgi:hypothetical protein
MGFLHVLQERHIELALLISLAPAQIPFSISAPSRTPLGNTVTMSSSSFRPLQRLAHMLYL